MLTQDRTALRQAYLEAWRKARDEEPLEPIEQQIVDIARQHPEYHALLEAGDDVLDRDWLPETGDTNPFLHMALHIAVIEQLTTDRPPGIRKLYNRLLRTCLGDAHEAEHRIMTCIAEEMWKIQRYGKHFDDKRYMKCIKKQGGGAHAPD